MADPAAGAVYPIVYFDALFVKVREDRWSGPAPATWPSASPATATARSWGIWWQETEGAKFWLAVLNDLQPPRRPGCPDLLRRRP